MTKLRPLLVFGTRPEAIKMAPVVRECLQRRDELEAIVCLTGQHRDMLDQVVEYFGIEPDDDFQLMRPNQSLAEISARCLSAMDEAIERFQPDCVVAQGDTTTVMAASLAAFFRRTPFVHVEAGLRTGNLLSPWPEELNRRISSLTAGLHCAPTQRSADNLLAESIAPAKVHVTGNTVIDALRWTVQRERDNDAVWRSKYDFLGDRRLVLITGHRRENFGDGLKNICSAIAELAQQFADVAFVYPVHLNPNVKEPVDTMLGGRPNVHLAPPVSYPEFIWLMDRSYVILTDSGGVQEEAPSLRRPVLVMRDTTERPEALEAGACELVGTDANRIVARLEALLTDEQEYRAHQIDENPYGDGQAARRIVDLLLARAWEQQQ